MYSYTYAPTRSFSNYLSFYHSDSSIDRSIDRLICLSVCRHFNPTSASPPSSLLKEQEDTLTWLYLRYMGNWKLYRAMLLCRRRRRCRRRRKEESRRRRNNRTKRTKLFKVDILASYYFEIPSFIAVLRISILSCISSINTVRASSQLSGPYIYRR